MTQQWLFNKQTNKSSFFIHTHTHTKVLSLQKWLTRITITWFTSAHFLYEHLLSRTMIYDTFYFTFRWSTYHELPTALRMRMYASSVTGHLVTGWFPYDRFAIGRRWTRRCLFVGSGRYRWTSGYWCGCHTCFRLYYRLWCCIDSCIRTASWSTTAHIAQIIIISYWIISCSARRCYRWTDWCGWSGCLNCARYTTDHHRFGDWIQWRRANDRFLGRQRGDVRCCV